MDFGKAVGAEVRETLGISREGQPVRVVRAERIYATGRDDLWQALTDPERLPRWFLPVSGDLKPGGTYQLEGNAGGTITRCDPPDVLELTWEYAGIVSWVSVRLLAEGAGTRLTLEHTMPKDPESEAHWAQYGPGATGVGWDLSFLGLGLYLDGNGAAVDKEAMDQWMASEAGKVFIRSCAEAWGAAHIAAGEAEDKARAMAKSTGDAYTGE